MSNKWQPGQSGNPKGKKCGTQNRTTIAARKLLEANATDVLEATITAAKGGDMIAARLVLGLIYPKRIRPAIALPSLETPHGIAEALATVATEVANGTLEADQARALATTIEAAGRQIDANKHLAAFLGAVISEVCCESPDTAKRITERFARINLDRFSSAIPVLFADQDSK